eukprot:TRINITY_DN11936_c0_g2_i5.p1 TRINITY_DN11936_c0_g2~~TRINITY_DN11936_c0_g2_i5.p1  ORF type:complete len:270 (-),score=43.62 TRINITY_DN11936_c0_g2_i5:133-942(-)
MCIRDSPSLTVDLPELDTTYEPVGHLFQPYNTDLKYIPRVNETGTHYVVFNVSLTTPGWIYVVLVRTGTYVPIVETLGSNTTTAGASTGSGSLFGKTDESTQVSAFEPVTNTTTNTTNSTNNTNDSSTGSKSSKSKANTASNYNAVDYSIEKDPTTPSPYQIKNGRDAKNYLRLSSAIEVLNTSLSYFIQIDGLFEQSNYTAFFGIANAQPGYPEFMDVSKVMMVNFSTNATIKQTVVETIAMKLQVPITLMLGLLFAFIANSFLIQND